MLLLAISWRTGVEQKPQVDLYLYAEIECCGSVLLRSQDLCKTSQVPRDGG